MSVESVNKKRELFNQKWAEWRSGKIINQVMLEKEQTLNEKTKGLVKFVQAEKPEYCKRLELCDLQKPSSKDCFNCEERGRK